MTASTSSSPVASGRRPFVPAVRPAALLAGGLLATVLLGGAIALTFASQDRSAASAAVQSTPILSPHPPVRTAERASRGGGRTALASVRYVTRTVAVGNSFSGMASWYGPRFQGRRTASGETFDTRDLTAASPTLPFGTRLRVCRVERCVVVRINDRGPYSEGRILDLSRAARDALGFSGVARVTATPVRTRQVAQARHVTAPKPTAQVSVRAASAVAPSAVPALMRTGSDPERPRTGTTAAVAAGGLALAAGAARLRHLRS